MPNKKAGISITVRSVAQSRSASGIVFSVQSLLPPSLSHSIGATKGPVGEGLLGENVGTAVGEGKGTPLGVAVDGDGEGGDEGAAVGDAEDLIRHRFRAQKGEWHRTLNEDVGAGEVEGETLGVAVDGDSEGGTNGAAVGAGVPVGENVGMAVVA